jgi:mRNA interferase MazF
VTGRLRRGDVVTVAAGSGFGGKPRLALVLQSDGYSELSTVVLALFTTETAGAALRPLIEPSDVNGLRQRSELMVDILVTTRREKVGEVLGRLAPADMARAERAVLLFLGFA